MINKPKGHWNRLKNLKAEARKYTSRSAFKNGSQFAYTKASKQGLLDAVCVHMKPSVSVKPRFVYVQMAKIGKKTHVYVGLSVNSSKRLAQHKSYGRSPVQKLCKMPNLVSVQITDKPVPAWEAAQLEKTLIAAYSSNPREFKVLNKAVGGGLGSAQTLWTPNLLAEEAAQYAYRFDFKLGSPTAYSNAQRLGLLDEVCAHMVEVKKHKGFWGWTTCGEAAFKCRSRQEFSEKYPQAYRVARQNAWLDALFPDNKRENVPKNWWLDLENCLAAASLCSSRSEFKKRYDAAYKTCLRLGRLHALFPNRKTRE